jgi:hypothetical protein
VHIKGPEMGHLGARENLNEGVHEVRAVNTGHTGAFSRVSAANPAHDGNQLLICSQWRFPVGVCRSSTNGHLIPKAGGALARCCYLLAAYLILWTYTARLTIANLPDSQEG